MVSSFVKNEKLREVLSFHTLLVGGNPMKTSAIYALIHKLEKDGGVWFARGGTNKLIAAMVTQILMNGCQTIETFPRRAARLLFAICPVR